MIRVFGMAWHKKVNFVRNLICLEYMVTVEWVKTSTREYQCVFKYWFPAKVQLLRSQVLGRKVRVILAGFMSHCRGRHWART